MRSRSLSYMPALDGLRAVAVLMVFAHHALPFGYVPGAVGVDIFFVISGFLITRILLREVDRTSTIDLTSFYVRRLLRLYPALVLVVVAVVAYYVLVARGLPQDRLLYAGVALTYTSNIFATVTGNMMVPLGHTWSLALEEQFYLLWPAVLLGLHRLKVSSRAAIAVLSVATAASFVGYVLTVDAHPYNPLTRCGALLVGCILAFAVAKRPWFNPGLGYAAVGVIVAVIAADAGGVINDNVTVPLVVLSVPFVILLVAFGDGPLVRALSTRPVVHLGVVSYGFYLFHYPIVLILEARRVGGWTIFFVSLVATVIVTELSFRFIERPALRLKDRIGRSTVARTQEAAPATR